MEGRWFTIQNSINASLALQALLILLPQLSPFILSPLLPINHPPLTLLYFLFMAAFCLHQDLIALFCSLLGLLSFLLASLTPFTLLFLRRKLLLLCPTFLLLVHELFCLLLTLCLCLMLPRCLLSLDMVISAGSLV